MIRVNACKHKQYKWRALTPDSAPAKCRRGTVRSAAPSMNFLAILITLIAALFVVSELHAHPMGTKLYGHRMTVLATPDAIKIAYIVEIPTSKLVLMMDRYKKKHGFERLGPEEERAFNEDMRRHLTSNLQLTVGGRSVRLVWDPNYAPSQGAGDYRFFEYRLYLIAPLEEVSDEGVPFSMINRNFRMERAVFHNEVQHLPGAYVADADVPRDMGWSEDSKFRLLSGVYRRGEAPPAVPVRGPERLVGKTGGTQLLGMLRIHELTLNIIIIALITALFLGAVHALSPGHGKALVAAYLVGSHGTIGHAVLLGLIVTLTHVFSVILIGIVSLIAAHYVVPEYYMPFISLASGLLIVVIGIWLIIKRVKGRAVRAEHDHVHPGRDVGWRTLLAFGVTGGIVPCPSALVVMLSAIAIGRIAFGFLLILFFSLGLAATLTVIGIIAVKAARLLDRFAATQILTRWLPLASAIVIALLGLAIIYQGFWVEWYTWR